MNADLMSTIENVQRQYSADGSLGLLRERFAPRCFHSFIVSTLPSSESDEAAQLLPCDGSDAPYSAFMPISSADAHINLIS